MKASDLRKVRKAMEKELDAKRFEHTLGVAYTAAALAMCHDADVSKAEMAGMLHDSAKCMKAAKLIALCKKNNMEISDVENRNPYLLHGKAGCCIARKKYHIDDEDILNAILYHTTGRPGMSQLEKIIYIADYIEPGRKQAPDLDIVRKMAFQNLDEALIKILSDTLRYLENIDGEIDPMTKKTFDYYGGKEHDGQ